jgi:hypothetical protein
VIAKKDILMYWQENRIVDKILFRENKYQIY